MVVARSRHLKHLHQFGINAIAEKVVLARVFNFLVFLTEYGKCGILVFANFAEQAKALLSAYDNRRYHSREQSHVAGSKYWYFALYVYV